MKREKDRAEHSYLGVWDPAGGEIREGSGLPVEEGQEEIRIVTRLLRGKGKSLEISREELQEAVGEAQEACAAGRRLWRSTGCVGGGVPRPPGGRSPRSAPECLGGRPRVSSGLPRYPARRVRG